MRHTRVLVSVILASAGFVAAHSAPAAAPGEPAVPFHIGETLTYDVSWSTFVTAGTATLSVKGRKLLSPGVEAYDLVAEGAPIALVDKLYHVYYKAETFLNTRTLQPTQATIYSDERGRTKLQTTRFTGPTTIVYQSKATAAGETHSVPKFALDPLSAVYVMRVVPLKAGLTLSMPLVDGGSVYDAHWHVSGPTTLKTALGPIAAWELAPVLTDAKGAPLTNRRMAVWVSSDARRLPLRMDVALAVGSFTLTLSRAGG